MHIPPSPQFGNVLIHPTVMQGFQISEHLCGIEASGRAILSLITASFRKESDTVTVLGAIVKAVEGILEAKDWVFYRVNGVPALNADYLQRWRFERETSQLKGKRSPYSPHRRER